MFFKTNVYCLFSLFDWLSLWNVFWWVVLFGFDLNLRASKCESLCNVCAPYTITYRGSSDNTFRVVIHFSEVKFYALKLFHEFFSWALIVILFNDKNTCLKIIWTILYCKRIFKTLWKSGFDLPNNQNNINILNIFLSSV